MGIKINDKGLVIFDSDGTLYRMPNLPFPQTPFYQRIREKAIEFVGDLERCSLNEARSIFGEIEEMYGLELSHAFKERYGIERLEYFERTWGQIDPSEFMDKYDSRTFELFKQLNKRLETAILTNAPRPWLMNVLKYLELDELFNGRIWIGEEGPRKPNPEAYLQITSHFGISPEKTIMVGDEEKRDVVPPKKLGMTAVRINPYEEKTVADFSVESIKELFSLIDW